ncbi:MAG: RNA methyltransferase [Candidatus Sericytochromatia bacterium]|nr:MAG: RNA methyltransferase [Candidatus Sericytochromatia bacterium]
MIKVTGGTLKGYKINTLKGFETRPTSSKVREAIFNIIQANVVNSNWLDCFSGSGIIGIEALSRGALKVTFVEKTYNSYTTIINNLKKTNLIKKSDIYKMDFFKFINKCNEKYDFIYFDPPYQSNYYQEFSNFLTKKNLLNENGILIVEHESNSDLSNTFINLHFTKTYNYGRTSLSFFKNIIE